MTSGPPIDPAVLAKGAQVLRGMAYEHRLHVLTLLCAGEATPSALAEVVPVHVTALSHHLRHLVDAGLVRRRRRGRQVFYSLANESTRRLVDEVLRYTVAD